MGCRLEGGVLAGDMGCVIWLVMFGNGQTALYLVTVTSIEVEPMVAMVVTISVK